MKTKYYTFLFLFFLSFGSPIRAQEVPIVDIEQGEIIGSLPYGRHFFIGGSAILPSGDSADSIVVRIYRTGNRDLFRKRRNAKPLTSDVVGKITAGGSRSLYFIKESVWLKYRSEDQNRYRVYINQPLQFATQYLVEVNYFKRYNFSFSEAEKTIILENTIQNSIEYYSNHGESINDKIVENYLNSSVLSAMKTKVEASGDDFLGFGEILENNPIVEATSLTVLSEEYVPIVAAIQAEITNLNKDINTKKNQRQAANSNNAEALNEAIEELENTINDYEIALRDNSDQLSDRLNIIKRQLALVVVDSPIAPTTPTGLTELDAVKVGTSFGGGGIFYNPQNPDLREINALSYATLNFYFLPVDKRIDEPYLSSFPILNRTSLMFGVVTSGAFEYRGQELEKPIGLSPILGLSLDINRYFSIDAGTTVFRQPSTSALSSSKKTRFAPIIGLSFDFDAFNRVKAMTDGQGPYNIPLTP